MTRKLAPSSRIGMLHGNPQPHAGRSTSRRRANVEKTAYDYPRTQGGVHKINPTRPRPQAPGTLARHGDYFQPAPMRETTGRSPLHEAIRDHHFEEAQKLIARGQDLDAQDSRGQTPLHYAASRDYVHLAQLLLARGARGDIPDGLGDTPLHTAARHSADGATWLLGKQLETQTSLQLPFLSQASVAHMLTSQQLPRKAERYAFLDRITEALSGTQRDLNAHDAVLKYVGHLMSMRGVAAGRVSAEGWHFDTFLFQRLRSQIAMYYQPEQLVAAAPAVLQTADIQALLVAEITRTIRSLVLVRHVSSQAWVSKKPRALLERHATHTILHAVRTLPPDDELTLPVGTPQHAIYINLRPCQVAGVEVVRLRVDNLGWGWNWGHFALEKNGRVGPFAMNIPRAYLDDPAHTEAIEVLLAGIMRRMHDDKDDLDVFYAQLSHLEQQLSASYGAEVIRTMVMPQDSYWKTKQTSGNCVLKNHSVGVWARLGYALAEKLGTTHPQLAQTTEALWRAFKERESELALDRLWNFVMTPNAFRERDCESKATKLQALLRDKKSRKNGLVTNFLRKPNRATIGMRLSAHDLTPLVTDGDVSTLRELLARGVDLSHEAHHRTSHETLLHVAVRSSAPTAPDMIKLLIAQGVPCNEEDVAGETPYALAARLRHGEALMALLEVGVQGTQGPAAWLNLEACLQRQLDDTARALALLKARGPMPGGDTAGT